VTQSGIEPATFRFGVCIPFVLYSYMFSPSWLPVYVTLLPPYAVAYIISSLPFRPHPKYLRSHRVRDVYIPLENHWQFLRFSISVLENSSGHIFLT
jgi:hypothetical protein